jgi:hypothetical protein
VPLPAIVPSTTQSFGLDRARRAGYRAAEDAICKALVANGWGKALQDRPELESYLAFGIAMASLALQAGSGAMWVEFVHTLSTWDKEGA